MKLELPQLGDQEASVDILQEKYCKDTETKASEIFTRVARGLAAPEKDPEHWVPIFEDVLNRGFVGAGRIMSAAGTDINATLINCFVQPIGDSSIGHLPDGTPGIMTALSEAMETQRRGGGVGYNFSSLRPLGAKVKGTRSKASGPLPFADMFDSMCKTVESAGARRGAQMLVLDCDHPDIEAFVEAKYQKGRLNNFNMSVRISDPFMRAVKNDDDWGLVHEVEPCADLVELGAKPHPAKGWLYRTIRARDLWDKIMRSTYHHAEPGVLFGDRIQEDNNLWYCENIVATNPCGEQPLPAYGACDLGPMILPRYVRDPFTPHAYFDYAQFRQDIPVAVRMLDNVLDVTHYPLEQQRQESMSKRRIGLGYTGLGDALIMLNLPYHHEEARTESKEIHRVLSECSYLASVELAKEKGAFPLFDAELYLAGQSRASRLPGEIQEAIRLNGIRNSHVNSVAPTGTISVAFADNCSNGIEPAFSWFYTRNKRMADGSKKAYLVEDHAYRLYRHIKGIPPDAQPVSYAERSNQVPGELYEENGVTKFVLPEAFVSALDLSAMDHLLMQVGAQPYIDTAISKTVNVPEDYSYEAFKDIYLMAWEYGLKGITTYRPNDVLGAVLEVNKDPAKQQPADLDLTDPDRRIKLEKAPVPALASLRWPGRPKLSNGNPAWTYMVEHPQGDFAVFVGHVVNGRNKPFEVWVNGAEQPRGLGAVAKTLSMDMRAEDPAWLRYKLETLAKASGDDAFDMPMPPDGNVTRMPSIAAGLAKIVQHRCAELGGLEVDGEPTPVMDALFALKEPKAGPDGTLSWTTDILNPATGDDFVLGLKELVMPDGTRRPYSMWLSGVYPKVLDGLCKLLSLDMRVVDPAWIGMKLRKLLNYSEPLGDFMARTPGSEKQQNYPSTIAYIARLMIHRYAMLEILADTGYPVSEMGVLAIPESSVKAVVSTRLIAGKTCAECGNSAVIKKDGCDFCTACGAIGSCG